MPVNPFLPLLEQLPAEQRVRRRQIDVLHRTRQRTLAETKKRVTNLYNESALRTQNLGDRVLGNIDRAMKTAQQERLQQITSLQGRPLGGVENQYLQDIVNRAVQPYRQAVAQESKANQQFFKAEGKAAAQQETSLQQALPRERQARLSELGANVQAHARELSLQANQFASQQEYLSAMMADTVAGSVAVDAGFGAWDPAMLRGASPTAAGFIQTAMRFLGTPYRWGGANPRTGFDCSGLIQYAARAMGINLPRVARQQAQVGFEVPGGLQNARPGDLVAFGSPVSHIGIYLGNGLMLHAPRTGDVVKISRITGWPSHVRRVF